MAACAGLAPDFAGARENLARVHLNLREYGLAREQYVELLEQDPRNPVFLYLFGVTLEADGNATEAIPYYELALDIDPDFEDARQALERARQAANTEAVKGP